MHLWTLDNWTSVIDNTRTGSGLRLIIDKDVDEEVKAACKDFAKWLRKEYFFPLRVRVYIKNKEKITARDGEAVYGTMLLPNDFQTEPYARIAAGDFAALKKRWGRDSALTAVLKIIAHELSHYYQWINQRQLTPMGEERQAAQYAWFILDEYAATRDRP